MQWYQGLWDIYLSFQQASVNGSRKYLAVDMEPTLRGTLQLILSGGTGNWLVKHHHPERQRSVGAGILYLGQNCSIATRNQLVSLSEQHLPAQMFEQGLKKDAIWFTVHVREVPYNTSTHNAVQQFLIAALPLL